MAQNFVFLNESPEDDGDEDNSSGGRNNSSMIDPLDDDYYSILNVPRNASTEEIQNQYRKFSRIFHPDKHSQDPETQAKAEQLFGKIKTAYEVLLDQQKRAIYDSLGTKGLDPDRNPGLEIVSRYRTPMEIREEFERLQKEREERLLERKTNPKGQVTVNINASEIFTPYEGYEEEDDEYYYETGPYIELTGFHFYQSIEAPVTAQDTLTMAGSVSADNGRGKGNINFGWRKWINSRAWGEAEVGGSTNGLDFSLKGYSQVGNRYFTNFATGLQSTQDGLKPNLSVILGSQLDSKSSATLTYRAGGLGGLQTQYTWDNSVNRFVASFHLGIPHSYAGIHVARRSEDKGIKYRASIRGGTFGLLAEYGIDKKVSQITTLSATMSLGIPIGVSLRIKVSRANQVYVFPIHLSDQVLPAPVVYGTVVPLLGWIVVDRLLVQPYHREQAEKEKAKTKAQYKTRLAEKKQEAENAIKLMEVTRARIVSEEESKGGLIITSAKYGRIGTVAGGTFVTSDEIIDVTVPLQIMVKDSKLFISDGPKCNLTGFYDPAPGEEKSLKIQYSFANKNHEVVFADEDAVRLPKDSHRTR